MRQSVIVVLSKPSKAVNKMNKSTTECRKDCDVFDAWRKLEAQNTDLVLDKVKLQAELDKYRWIPVSKRLPNSTEKVLCTDGTLMWEDCYLQQHEKWRLNEKYTHWRPLILPQEQSNES